MARKNFMVEIGVFSEWVAKNRPPPKGQLVMVTVSVTEKYARRKLKIKKPEPVVYKNLGLVCIGSQRWRTENAKDILGK